MEQKILAITSNWRIIGQQTNHRINLKAGSDFLAECEKEIDN